MAKYYEEPIEKDTRYRTEYADGIAKWLESERAAAEARRAAYFSPEAYRADPAAFRRRYVEMLGFPLTAKRETPRLAEKTFVARDGNADIYRVQLEFFGAVKLYGIFFRQTEGSEKAPFVLTLHGGSGTPEFVASMHMNSANYNHLTRRITDRGANAFAPQLLLWNKEIYGDGYNRPETDGKLRQLGGSITALELYFMRGAIDYFLENEGMNADRVGVAGLSYGGMYSLHLAALDERIKACYSCSFVSDAFRYSWEDWSYPNAQNTIATAETMALVAPRALAVAMGNRDELFDSRLTEKECAKAREFFRALGAEDKFLSVIFDGVHETDKGDEEIEFLLKNL